MAVRESPGNATKDINQELSQRRGWILTVAVGFALHFLSFVIGLKTRGPLCGSSPLMPQSRAAEEADSQMQTTRLAEECYRNIDAARGPVWMLMALGIALVLTGVAVRIIGIRRSVNRSGKLTGDVQD